MKRHESLVSLSREHHTALVEAKRLRAQAANPEGEQVRDAARRILAFWNSGLRRHFLMEEEILLPVLARHTGSGHQCILDTFLQHLEIRRILVELAEQLEDEVPIDAVRIRQLGDLLSAHVRFEESVLLPLIEDVVPARLLEQLGERLVAASS